MVENGSESVKVVIDPTLKPNTSIPNVVVLKQGTGLLSGKLAVVTGSSRGLGREIAKQLCSLGAYVSIHGTNEKSPSYLSEGTTMTNLALEISQQYQVSVHSVTGDLTDIETTESVFQQIHNFWNMPIDILICCSGGNIGAAGVNHENGGKPDIDDCIHISAADMNHILAVNLNTVINTCKAVVPEMQKRNSGKIITIGSIAGCSGRNPGAMYAVAKAAVHEYTRCLAAQLLGTGVKVNCIAPGPISTERYKRNVNGKLPELVSSIEEVAQAVVLLCRTESNSIHGQLIRVDKGTQLF